jgi:hypothetical protein
MALTDTLIGDKPVKVEVSITKDVRNIVIAVLVSFVIITFLIVRHRKKQS